MVFAYSQCEFHINHYRKLRTSLHILRKLFMCGNCFYFLRFFNKIAQFLQCARESARVFFSWKSPSISLFPDSENSELHCTMQASFIHCSVHIVLAQFTYFNTFINHSFENNTWYWINSNRCMCDRIMKIIFIGFWMFW